MSRVDSGGRSALILPFAVALTALAFYLLAFFPGTLCFDSAYQWWQARGHETSNIHGIGMTLLWRLGDAVAASPAPLFALQLALLWGGLLLIAVSLPVSAAWRAAFLLVAGFAPVVFVLFTSVLSDAVLAGLLCCALGICVWAGERIGYRAFLLVLALLLLAMLVRKNAAPAVLPIAVLAVQRVAANWPLRRCLFAATALCAALYAADVLFERSVDRRVTVFPATAIWDLAAVSIDVDALLLPASTYEPGLDVSEIRRAFTPHSNTSLFADTQHGIVQPFLAPDDPRDLEIRHAWFGAMLQHPRAYLAHRWRVIRGLLGSKAPQWPAELVFFPADTQYRDNPRFAANTSSLHAWFMQRIDTLRSTSVLAAWPYLLLGCIAGILAWRRRHLPLAGAALAAAASGLLYAAPLSLIAPSVELRYLGWTCLAAVLAAGLAFAAPAKRALAG